MAANVIMASSTKSVIPKPKLPAPTKLPFLPTTNLRLPSLKSLTTTLSPSLKSLTAASVLSLPYFLPHPSLAAEIEKASLFDFNLTLPIIAAEFLFLMVALDKVYYSPLGNFMDERDTKIKKMLAEVQGGSDEVKQLEDQANAIMRAARAEVAAAVNKMRKETSVEVEAMLEVGRTKVEGELKEALENLERQKEATIKAMDSQANALSEDIVKKVLPAP